MTLSTLCIITATLSSLLPASLLGSRNSLDRKDAGRKGAGYGRFEQSKPPSVPMVPWFIPVITDLSRETGNDFLYLQIPRRWL
jgi:hypothetical protein